MPENPLFNNYREINDPQPSIEINFNLNEVLEKYGYKDILEGTWKYVQEIDARIACDLKYGENLRLGFGCIIGPGVELGDNAIIGHRTILKSDIKTGDGLKLGYDVSLAAGTRIGNRVDMSNRSCTTGVCFLGDDVKVRERSTVSNSLIVEQGVFMGAGIMSSHTQHVSHFRPQLSPEQFITRIGYGAIIGSGVQLGAGVKVGHGAIVGYNTFVPPGKQLQPYGVYMNQGDRASLRKVLTSEDPEYVPVPPDYRDHYLHPDLLRKYLPGYKIPQWLENLVTIAQMPINGVLVPPAGWQQPQAG